MDKNLTIRILGKGPTFEVTAETDNSSATGQLTLPPELLDLANMTRGMGGVSREAERETPVADAVRPDVRALGQKLFEQLFSGRVGELLRDVLASAGTGVRVRLNLTASDEAAALAALPWEILTPNTGTGDTPLAFGKKSVLVRTIDVTDESAPLAFEPPLRILFVVSNPTGTAALNLKAERDQIIQAFGGEPRGVSFGATVRATREAIADALVEAKPRYHVVHFMGHGDFDPATGRGAILLEHEDGTPDRVEGEQLRVLLERAAPQLVFLNACKTATTGSRGEVNPFGGVAAALLAGGIPSVVAMQYPITDKAAIRFASTFYKRVATGMAVDCAVAEARAMLYDGTDTEWATPVLYLRPKHGVIFSLTADIEAARVSASLPTAQVAQVGPVAPVAQVDQTAAAPMALDATRVAPAGSNAPARLTPSAAMVAQSAAAGATPFRVFLAATAITGTFTQRVRPQLIKDLAVKGIEVLSSAPSQDNPDEFAEAGHEARVRELAKGADLFVHIFNETAGDLLDGASVTDNGVPATFPIRQFLLGAQLQKPQLVLVNDAAAIDPTSEYGKFLAQLESSDRDRTELEFARARLTKMADAIAERRDQVLAARARTADAARMQATSAQGLAAYIDVHKEDLDQVEPLIQYLESKGVRVEYRPTMGDPKVAEERFRAYLRSSPAVILFYGKVGAQWVTSRYLMAVQQKIIENLPTRITLYVGAPDKSEQDLQFANNMPVARNSAGFDPAAVDALLTGMRA